MPRKHCERCDKAPAALKRPRNGQFLCAPCFFQIFEEETHQTIVHHNLFQPGDVVACGASGGKDSTVLMHLMQTLNQRHRYGVELVLVSVDEGIKGYRDDSLKTVHRNSEFYGLSLKIVSFKELYGWSMDEIVTAVGDKNNCTFCGVFRRQALDRGAALVGANKIVTGHNADDTAETVLMNVLRSDIPRLKRCVEAVTADASVVRGDDGEEAESGMMIPRVKPLKYAYEKEIVLYAHFLKLDYFTTECTYSKEAFRGNARVLLKELESIRTSSIADTIHSGETLTLPAASTAPIGRQAQKCTLCGYLSSQTVCRACVLLKTLNEGKAKIAVHGTTSAAPTTSTNTNTTGAVAKRGREGE